MSPSGFIRAMDKANYLQHGENNSLEYTSEGVENSRVALFFALVRDIPTDRLQDLLQRVVLDGKDNEEVIADLFIIAFQTRHCRGGKGERSLFYHMIMELALLYPETTKSLMTLVPYYGTFKDWFQLVLLSRDEKKISNIETRTILDSLADYIMTLACDQLLRDRDILYNDESIESLSLISKWAPREGKNMDGLAKELANKVFPNSKSPKKDYRQLLSRLNTAINTVEVKMSSNQWDTIDFTTCPSVALMKYRKAFLNECVRGEQPMTVEMEETGNRHPVDNVRVACRKRLRDTLSNEKASKLKGRQLFPHEIVRKFIGDPYSCGRNICRMSDLEKDILYCQWNDIRVGVLEAMSKIDGRDNDVSGLNLGKMVSLVDVSGSMSGTPMEVAIALGLLVSEIASPEYGNRCLTFSAKPQWVILDKHMSIEKKVKMMVNAPWGMNTDFEAATEKILNVAIKANLAPDDIPDLIVFSDMQFDQARNQGDSRNEKWEIHHERIVQRFRYEGLKVCGQPWPAPHIIYWNLRGSTTGFPVNADTPGVTMLSGFSPSLMKLLLSGEPVEKDADEIDLHEGKNSIKRRVKTPFHTIRKALDNEDYDMVRELLYASREGILKMYKKPVTDSIDVTKDDWEVI